MEGLVKKAKEGSKNKEKKNEEEKKDKREKQELKITLYANGFILEDEPT